MKKYFLFISLFTLVFLWLGNNYSFAQWTIGIWWFCTENFNCQSWLMCLANQCITDPSAWNNNTQSCIENAFPSTCPSNQTCIGGICINTPTSDCGSCRKLITPQDIAQGCDYTKESQKSCNDWWIWCCPMAAGTTCLSPHWWEVNALWFCACPTWFKNVNNECKHCSDPNVCCGISLNTSIPFIGNCIEDNFANRGPGETSVTWATAFPVLMWSLTKILVTFILIISFVLIIVGGIMIATGNRKWWMDMIRKVVIGIALLGASGVILRLINPNFFG